MRKRILFIIALCLSALSSVQAQIENGLWYNGWLVYTATTQADGKVLLNGMSEGEEHEFVLVPVAGKSNTYSITDGKNGYVNEHSEAKVIKHLKNEGLDVLCFYDNKNMLLGVMSKETEWDNEKINKYKWLSQIIGEYTCNYLGKDIKIAIDAGQMSAGGILAFYDAVTFNGLVTGYIEIEPGKDGHNPLTGTWEVVPTLEGLHLYKIKKNGDYLYDWVRDGNDIVLTESNPNRGRFFYASYTLLNDKWFTKFDKPTLRIMRNAILAKNGYRFNSKDLQEYFGKEPWYHPAANNNDIKLSFIEQLNVELIKCAEEKKLSDEENIDYIELKE